MAPKAWCCWPKWEGLWPPGTLGPLYSRRMSACCLTYSSSPPSALGDQPLCIDTRLCVDTRLFSLRTNQPKLVCDFLPGLSIYYYASKTIHLLCTVKIPVIFNDQNWIILVFANHVSLKDWFVIRDWTFLSSNHPESYPPG